MEFLTGEFEAFLYSGRTTEETIMRVSMECIDPGNCDQREITDSFLHAFFYGKKHLEEAYNDGMFQIMFHYTPPGDLELYHIGGRPRRLVDRRS
jgi:phenylacetate-coenzyme A ligase PaaK-like adenylate-forming protein